MTEIGEIVECTRRSMRLGVSEFAEALGGTYGHAHISAIEAGALLPSDEFLFDLARASGMAYRGLIDVVEGDRVSL